jgi:hypothetical protein
MKGTTMAKLNAVGLPTRHLPDRFGAMVVEPDGDLFQATVAAPLAWRRYTPWVKGGETVDGPWLRASGRTRAEAFENLERLVGAVALDELRHVEPERGRRVMDVAVRIDPPFDVTLEAIWEHIPPPAVAGTLWSWLVRYDEPMLSSMLRATDSQEGREKLRDTRVGLVDLYDRTVATRNWATARAGASPLDEAQPLLRPLPGRRAPFTVEWVGAAPEYIVLFVEVAVGRCP